MNLDLIFAKFEKQFNRGPNRSGYLTPADANELVRMGLASYMGANTQKWVEESMASGIMNPRWTTLALTKAGFCREPLNHSKRNSF